MAEEQVEDQTMQAVHAARAAEKAQASEGGETKNERPSWLDPKFETPEAMAKAYDELQSKLGQKPKAPDLDRVRGGEEQPDRSGQEYNEPTPSQSFLPGVEASEVEAISQYAWENRSLSDEHYQKLEAAGYDRQLVDDYMAGQFARADAAEAQLVEIGGGEQQVEAMFEWATNNMTEQQIAGYNEMFDRGGPEAMMAMENLRSKYENSGAALGYRGVQGANAAFSDVQTFQSSAEVIEAMNDPRYQRDPAYRQEVMRRLQRSNALSGRDYSSVIR